MVDTRKFSQFGNRPLDEKVGLGAGANSRTPDDGGSGNIVKIINQDTSQLAVNRWVRINSAGLYVHGLATSPEEADIRGVVLNILGPNQFTLQQAGYIPAGTPGFSGFVPNQDYFLSDTMLGMATQTLPTTNGHINKPLFSADSSESGWVICLERGMVIGTPGPIPPSPVGGSDTSIRQISQPGNTFTIGQWVRCNTELPNLYTLANGNSLANAQSVGVVIQNGDPLFTVQFSGYNSNTVTQAYDSAGVIIPGGIVAGTVYYISDVVPGQLTPTAPTNITSASRPAFISESALNGTGWVLPQRPLPSFVFSDPNIKLINQPAHGFLSNGLVVKPQTGALNLGKYELAIANNLTTSFGVGMIRIVDVDNFYIQEVGYFSGFYDVPPVPGGVANPSSAGALLNGVPYYLSATNAGQITNVEPANPNFSKPMFEADQVNAGWILPMKPTGAGGGGGGGDAIRDYDVCNLTTTFSTNTKTFVDVGMLCTVTTEAVTDLVVVWLSMPSSSSAAGNAPYFKILRGVNDTLIGDAAGSRVRCLGCGSSANEGDSAMTSSIFHMVDAPGSIGTFTYKVQMRVGDVDASSVYLNRSQIDSDNDNYARGACQMIVAVIPQNI